MRILTEEQIKKTAPSVFAEHASNTVSDRYTFIPTIDVVRGLQKADFYPVSVKQTKSRDIEKRGFARHVLRFRKEGVQFGGGLFPEIVLMNSHDKSSCYQLRCGMYRMVCANGLIVGDDFYSKKVRHSGNAVDTIIEAACELIEKAPETLNKAIEWEGISLTQEQRAIYAQSASMLKWDTDEIETELNSILVRDLLAPKRYQDKKTDLWTTFNTVQENIVRGGVRYRTKEGDLKASKKISSVKEDFKLNTALWNLAEKMAELSK